MPQEDGHGHAAPIGVFRRHGFCQFDDGATIFFAGELFEIAQMGAHSVLEVVLPLGRDELGVAHRATARAHHSHGEDAEGQGSLHQGGGVGISQSSTFGGAFKTVRRC